MESLFNGILRGMEFVLALGAVIVAVGVGIRRVYRMAKNIEDVLEKVDANHAAMIEAMRQLETTKHIAHEIKKEVRPNGGSSLRDAVNRIETRVAVLETWHAAEDKHRA